MKVPSSTVCGKFVIILLLSWLKLWFVITSWPKYYFYSMYFNIRDVEFYGYVGRIRKAQYMSTKKKLAWWKNFQFTLLGLHIKKPFFWIHQFHLPNSKVRKCRTNLWKPQQSKVWKKIQHLPRLNLVSFKETYFGKYYNGSS